MPSKLESIQVRELEAALTCEGSHIEEGADLKRLSHWGIGGRARCLFTPASLSDLQLGLSFFHRLGLPFRIVGRGSNLLIADRLFDEPILHTQLLNRCEIKGSEVWGECGLYLPRLAQLVQREGLSGLEFAAGVPGTVGGACMMNAGAHGQEWRAVCRAVTLWIAEHGLQVWHPDECGFGYRTSRFQKLKTGTFFIVSNSLSLKPSRPNEVKQRMDENLKSRREKTPMRHKTCGSVFKRPEGEYPGQVIEKAGCKGMRLGDAEVSQQHANYFINHGAASFEEMLALIEKVEQRVAQETGVKLDREVEIWR